MKSLIIKAALVSTVALGLASYASAPRAEGPSEPKSSQKQTATGIKASRAATKDITQSIDGVYKFCTTVQQKEYMVDCLGAGLDEIAESMPKTGDYAEAQAILENASVKLRALAKTNASKTLPKGRLSGTVNKKPVRTQTLTPVKTAALKSTTAQATAILKEAETLLLRSTANSDRRKVHYAQMAKAVGTGTVLLRSL